MSDGPRIGSARSGLRVATERVPGARSVAVGAWIGVGSRYETPAEAGVSHFLEHLLFKGTPTRGPREVAEAFDALGAEINAATGRDSTVLYARVLDERLDDAFEILADMLQRPVFNDLEQEREVVLEEIAMYEDEPQEKVHDLAAEALFPDQPLGRPVIGSGEVIASISREDIGAYHATHYTRPNIVVAAAGNVDHERMVGLCDRHLEGLPAGPAPGDAAPAAVGAPRLAIRIKETEQYHLSLAGPGVSRNDERRHAMQVLDTILGGSMSSRLFQEVREKRGLAYAVGSYSTGFADVGQVGVYVGTRAENVREVCEVIATELDRLAAEAVGEPELARARSHLTGRLVLGLESSGNRMNRLGRSVLTGTEFLTVEQIIERIAAVTADDVQALAEEFWRPGRFSVAAVGGSAAVIESGAARLSPALAPAAA